MQIIFKILLLAVLVMGYNYVANASPNASAPVISAAQTAAQAKPVVVVSKTITQPANQIKTVNKIIAFVNRGVITTTQINQQVQQTLLGFKQRGINQPDTNDVRNRVIDQLILQKIQLDLAARSGIKTSDIEVTDAINNIAKSQKMDLTTFKANITKDGMSFDDFRQQIQLQITIDKLKQRDVDGRIVVNDDEVNRVLNSVAYKNKIDYNMSDIAISVPEQATNEVVAQKQQLATAAYNDLKAGQSFNQVAVKYSNAPNALSGGDLGWKSSATLPPIIASAVKDLNEGDYTNIIRLPMGFFIFKINGVKKHGTPQIVKQYHVRHILVKVNETTSDEEAHQKILEIKSKLDKDASNPTGLNADFIKYAKQYSEDTSSINGGDIGWISKGDTVPAFEQTVLSTPIGVVSQPIHSPFGWHILEVLGTRDSNLTNDREKAEIRQDIHDNKAALLYTQWLRDIREGAYVKMNDN